MNVAGYRSHFTQYFNFIHLITISPLFKQLLCVLVQQYHHLMFCLV